MLLLSKVIHHILLCCYSTGEALTDAEVKSMIDEADKNGDGVIDYKGNTYIHYIS